MVGALRLFGPPPTLGSVALPLVHACSGWWQLSHDMDPSLESRLSKKSSYPSHTFSGVVGFSRGSSTAGRNIGVSGMAGGGGNFCSASARSDAAEPAAETAFAPASATARPASDAPWATFCAASLVPDATLPAASDAPCLIPPATS